MTSTKMNIELFFLIWQKRHKKKSKDSFVHCSLPLSSFQPFASLSLSHTNNNKKIWQLWNDMKKGDLQGKYLKGYLEQRKKMRKQIFEVNKKHYLQNDGELYIIVLWIKWDWAWNIRIILRQVDKNIYLVKGKKNEKFL